MGKRKGKVCAVVGCRNCDGHIRLWKTLVCETHAPLLHQHCPCPRPFSMHRIPQGEKNKVTRQCWLDNLQRANFDPNTASRVCSVHFVDGRPTEENPYPTLHLGTLSVRHVGTPGGVRCTAQSQLDKNLQLGASRGSRRRHSVINEHFVEVKAEDSLPSRSQLGPGIITYERPFRVYKQAMVSPKCSSCGCSFKAVDKMDKGIQAQLERNRDHTYYTDSKVHVSHHFYLQHSASLTEFTVCSNFASHSRRFFLLVCRNMCLMSWEEPSA